MGKRRGFTLMEVMVGMLIISLALIIFGSSYVGSVRNIFKGREANTAVSGLRNEMEKVWVDGTEEMIFVNKYWDASMGAWKPGSPSPPSSTPRLPINLYECCGMRVSGYPLKATVGNRSIYSFLSDKHQEVELPAITATRILSSTPRFQYLEATADTSITGKIDAIVNDHVLYDSQHRWYISNRFSVPHGSNGFLAKSYLEQNSISSAAPKFASDFTRLGHKGEKLPISRTDSNLRDVAVRYSAIPLGTNKYVGAEVLAPMMKYYIGLPLDANPLIAHYNAELVLDYDPSADRVAEVANTFAADNQWYDVRHYIKMTGFGTPNPLEIGDVSLERRNVGDFVSFDATSSALLKEKNVSLFLRIKDMEYDSGKKITVLQSPKVEALASDVGKKMFELTLENQKLMFYTKEVVKIPSAGPGIPEKIEVKLTGTDTLIADTRTQSSYGSLVSSATDDRNGFNVLYVSIKNGVPEKIEKFVVEKPGNIYNFKKEILPMTAVDSAALKIGDLEFAVEGDGKMAISDIVIYDREVSENFGMRVGSYLLERYLEIVG